MLGPTVLGLLRRMPADGGRIEKELGTLHGREPCALWKPLIPADQHADRRVARLPGSKPRVAGGEVELLVIERIIRDMHLAIHAQQRAVGIDDDGSVVIQPCRASFEQGADDHDTVGFRESLEGFGRRPGDGLGQLKEAMVFDLAKVLGAEQLLRADDLSAVARGALNQRHLLREIGVRIITTRHLSQGHTDGRHWTTISRKWRTSEVDLYSLFYLTRLPQHNHLHT